MIAGLIAMMRHDGEQPGPVNLGNPQEISILELAQRISRLTGHPLELSFMPLPHDDPQRRRPDISRAQTVLGWQPRISLEEGLFLTIKWFEQQASASAALCGLGSAEVAALEVAK
jgi:UDP-glucuronate decarboxylase